MYKVNWRPPSLSELTPMIFNMGLTYLGSEASNYSKIKSMRLSAMASILVRITPMQ